MENIFLFSMVISIIYIVLKYLEMKLIIKEPKPIKLIIRDALIVYISSISGFFVLSQFENNVNIKTQPNAFVGEANF
tara:strand:- start:101 stop:331 length:231 start_codon:yes stop_codon:yes gene_type:complete